MLSYFTDLQGSQTLLHYQMHRYQLSYFTDLQGSQTKSSSSKNGICLVTLLIYKVLKRLVAQATVSTCLVTLLIYKVLKL